MAQTPEEPQRLTVVELEQLCDQFEDALRAGHQPQMEALLVHASSPTARDQLLRELVALELEYRPQFRVPSARDSYTARFPEHSGSVAGAWDLAVAGYTMVGKVAPVEQGQTMLLPVAEMAQIASEAALENNPTALFRLAATPLFLSDIPQEKIGLIAHCLSEKQFALQETLIEQGTPGRGLWMLAEGTAEVRVRDHEGAEHQVRSVGPGTILGEMSLLTGDACTAMVVATSAGRGWFLPVADYFRLAQQCPELPLLLGELMGERLGCSTDIMLGKFLGGCRFEEVIGRGGMAIVYRAHDTITDRTVAVKMMSHRFAYDLEALRRFKAEADICQSLDHANILRMIRRFAAFGTQFIVLEHCPAGTLADRIAIHGPLPEVQVRRILGQLASALLYAHSKGIVHRDVKPKNVLFSADGISKLADFGLARSAEFSGDTPRGWILGTPGYMAPEQLDGSGATPQSDVFSLGCIAFEMITGRPLFDCHSFGQLLQSMHNLVLPRDGIRPDLGDDLTSLLKDSLVTEPSDRILSLSRLAEWGSPQTTL